ncbi:MAG: cellulase family glycosylhydrolase, partial [Chthoniobacteraceae bacterium]
LICPWARSDKPGYQNGGNKFDLKKWDESFFARLKDFMRVAAKQGVIVELNLFTPMYEQMQWDYSPMNAANNINGIGKVGKHEVYTLDKEPALLEAQLAMVRKLATELNDFDNLYFEVCNEPYFGGVTQAWHDKVAETIVATERDLPKKHLISWNVANGAKKVENPYPAYSIFNFHYANPPAAVAQNYGLNKAIGLNETGFKGTGDDYYRMEAWEFMLAGGALYNNLDYSFTAGHEDGTFEYPDSQPGGGNPGFRRQIAVLKRFLESFDFVEMKPARELLVQSELLEGKPKNARWQMLAEPSKQYALYVTGAPLAEFHLDLLPGNYREEWIDVRDGKSISSREISHPGGLAAFEIPVEPAEVAAKITRLP